MKNIEYWLRGPVENTPALLQPVAHALLQARDEIGDALKDFPDSLLWQKPAGVASVAFHLQHIPGAIDRLFTYATGNTLSEEQLHDLAAEGKEKEEITVNELLNKFNYQIEIALIQLRNTPDIMLLEPRGVGRKQLPSTVLGLLFHAAEHVQRHTGQLLVTAKMLTTA